MPEQTTTAEPPGLCATIERASAVAEQALRALRARLEAGTGRSPGPADPLGLGSASLALGMGLWREPWRLAGTQLELWWRYQRLVGTLLLRGMGIDSEPVAAPGPDDRRFRDPLWEHSPLFDFIKQAYLLTADAWLDVVAGSEELDPDTRSRLAFATRQLLDALSPSNFAASNPEVLRAIGESGGGSLLEGLANLLEDIERSPARLDISMCDRDAFEVGTDLATTPGKVVFRNALIELIQYRPSTARVYRRPLLVIPPWMNKFYIMDLRPGNSLVEWLVGQGHTVFMISWVNPEARHAGKDFEDYMLEGPLAALDAIERATGEREANVVGYCLGGILLAATLGWLAARGEQRVASATLLTTMVDFSEVGDVGLFIDEQRVEELERHIREVGYLDGRAVAATWRAVRANDLVWSFFVHNYLLGRRPAPLDLLYWNSDPTHLPAACHCFVLRRLYLENRLREPGGIVLAGSPVDVTRVRVPAYILATRDDHIAPWRTAYATTGLFSGPRRFVLGASGHIAGVINPPGRGKYGYWTGARLPADPEEWLAGARAHHGSWWPDWQRWVRRHGGGEVAAREPGDGRLAVLADAPGSYVRVRID